MLRLLSVEAGHKFALEMEQRWLAEPQLKLSYFSVKRQSFALSNGMRAEQEAAESLTGRLGLVLGRNVRTQSGGWQFSIKGGLRHEFLDGACINVNAERLSSLSKSFEHAGGVFVCDKHIVDVRQAH